MGILVLQRKKLERTCPSDAAELVQQEFEPQLVVLAWRSGGRTRAFHPALLFLAACVITVGYFGRFNIAGNAEGYGFMQVMAELEKHYADQLFSTKISRNVKLTEAPGFGKPVFYHDKNSKGAKEYIDVAKELSTRI